MGVPVSDPEGMLLNGARAPSMIQRVQSRRDASQLGRMRKGGDPVVGVPACDPGGTMRMRSRRDANAIPEGCGMALGPDS